MGQMLSCDKMIHVDSDTESDQRLMCTDSEIINHIPFSNDKPEGFFSVIVKFLKYLYRKQNIG